jgi:hypothetical protein
LRAARTRGSHDARWLRSTKPQIGDVKAGRWPQHYVTLAKVLKKIQIKDHYPFHFGGPGRLDHAASLAWLFRFDGK